MSPMPFSHPWSILCNLNLHNHLSETTNATILTAVYIHIPWQVFLKYIQIIIMHLANEANVFEAFSHEIENVKDVVQHHLNGETLRRIF